METFDYSFAYLGPLRNNDGEQFGTVYDKELLDFFQQDELRRQFAGAVWEQIIFMTAEEYESEMMD